MVKRRWLPCRGVVAGLARLREPLRRVVRICSFVEIGEMTRHAGRRSQIVVVVHMAIRALPRRHHVGAGEREVHHRVIEGRRGPGDRGMALRAVRREVCRGMIGIRCALEILQVTTDARRARQVVAVVDVAVDALARRHGMSAR